MGGIVVSDLTILIRLRSTYSVRSSCEYCIECTSAPYCQVSCCFNKDLRSHVTVKLPASVEFSIRSTNNSRRIDRLLVCSTSKSGIITDYSVPMIEKDPEEEMSGPVVEVDAAP